MNSLFSKAKGLMFTSSSAVHDNAMVFVFKKEKTVSLHMFFVFYPVDVIFLDQTKKVIEIKMNFKPFAIYIPKKKAKYVVECGAGAVRKSRTTIGDHMAFKSACHHRPSGRRGKRLELCFKLPQKKNTRMGKSSSRREVPETGSMSLNPALWRFPKK